MNDRGSEDHMAKQAIWKFVQNRWKILLVIGVVLFLGVLWFVGHNMDPEALLRKYGYWVILVWTLFEGETIVIVAGALSQSHSLNPWIIALCAFCGSFTVDQVTFSIGRYKGEALLQQFPKLESKVEKVRQLLKKYDTALILCFRFIYGVRNVTPILLGVSGVSHKKFFFLNMIGAAAWALSFTFGGVVLGKAFLHIIDKFGVGALILIVIAVAVVAGYFYFRSRDSRAKDGVS